MERQPKSQRTNEDTFAVPHFSNDSNDSNDSSDSFDVFSPAETDVTRCQPQESGCGSFRSFFKSKRASGRWHPVVPVSLIVLGITFLLCITVLFAAIYHYGHNNPQETGASALPELSVPAFSCASGQFDAPITLSISHTNKEGAVFYTMDGTEPNAQSSVYTAPVLLGYGTHTVRAAVIDGERKSSVASAVYTIVKNTDVQENQRSTLLSPGDGNAAAVSAPAEGVLYCVCIGSFADKENAEAAAAGAAKKGLSAFVIPERMDGAV